jgi:hypothetical protein
LVRLRTLYDLGKAVVCCKAGAIALELIIGSCIPCPPQCPR